MTDLIGQRLGQYEIVSLLGSGGMATVYRARQVSVKRDVAVKVILPHLAQTGDFIQRFEREAQTAASLSHPHILKVFDFGQQSDITYLVMELLTGGSLADLIRQQAFALETTNRLLDQIAQALDYAHQQGIVHRDLKPENVLVDQYCNAFLTDFGIAKLLQGSTGLTQSGVAIGTPPYMAPEQWRDTPVDARTDIYALGVILFEMLTGKLPFNSETLYSMMHMHIHELPPSVFSLKPELQPSVDWVVLRALAKDPADRFASAGEMAAAFRDAISESPPSISKGLRPTENELPKHLEPVNAVVSRPAQNRRLLLRVVGILFSVGLISLLGLALVSRQAVSPMVAVEPTAAETANDSPTPVPLSPTPTAMYSLTVSSTTAALPASPIAPSGDLPAMAALMPTVAGSTQVLAPPENRTVPPPNSRRLGEFAVEGYCNERGYGVRLVNKRSDWACINRASGAILFTLGPTDFDTICRSRYANPSAFAIRDQQKTVQAYNWSCYEYVQPTTVASSSATRGSAETPIPMASPSITTLLLRYDADWVALINTANAPLALQNVEFRRGNDTMKVTAWGRSVLMPGECLRIYKTASAPERPPAGCATAIDYPAEREERARWLEGKVTIAINPFSAYCYPTEACKD